MLTTYFRLVCLMVATMLLYSCKSLQRMAARDTSAKQPVVAKKKNRNNLQFIDDIAVSGGCSSGQIAETQSTSYPRRKKENTQAVYAPPTDVAASNYNIERATGLQFKYAILLDASVEKLTNIALLQTMDHWWGTQYCLGGNTENCIDCSAFTQIMMRDVYKTDVPRTARAQYDNSNRIAMEDLTEGDLVFFQTVGKDISHVGIYLTNNKFVHAATSNGVMVSDLNDPFWRSRYKGAGRVVKPTQIFSSVK